MIARQSLRLPTGLFGSVASVTTIISSGAHNARGNSFEKTGTERHQVDALVPGTMS